MLRKNIGLLVMTLLVVGMPLISGAGMRRLTQAPENLWLDEKTGKTENMLDNPAFLNLLTRPVIATNTMLAIEDALPFNAIYRQTIYQDSWQQTIDGLVPLPPILVLNLGGSYGWSISGSRNEAKNDDSTIEDLSKSNRREVHLGLGAGSGLGIPVGYQFSREQEDNAIDYLSQQPSLGQTDGDQYTNVWQRTSHQLGLSLDLVDLVARYQTWEYAASFDQEQQVDFNFTIFGFSARRVFGNLNEGNLTLQAGFDDYQLEQPMFIMARERYWLDLPVSTFHAGLYWYAALDKIETSLGLEGKQEARTRFSQSAQQWLDAQLYQLVLPMSCRVPVWPMLDLWMESRIAYMQDAGNKTQGFSLQTAWGIESRIDQWNIRLYTLPRVLVTQSETQSGERQLQLGLEAVYRF